MLYVGVMITKSLNCLKSPGWLTSIAEVDSIIKATLLTLLYVMHKKSQAKMEPGNSYNGQSELMHYDVSCYSLNYKSKLLQLDSQLQKVTCWPSYKEKK